MTDICHQAWLSPERCGFTSGWGGVEIEAAAMEGDEGFEVPDGGDASGALLDQDNFGVDGLQGDGGQAMATEGEDVVRMAFEQVGDPDRGAKLGTAPPAHPAFEEFRATPTERWRQMWRMVSFMAHALGGMRLAVCAFQKLASASGSSSSTMCSTFALSSSLVSPRMPSLSSLFVITPQPCHLQSRFAHTEPGRASKDGWDARMIESQTPSSGYLYLGWGRLLGNVRLLDQKVRRRRNSALLVRKQEPSVGADSRWQVPRTTS